MGVALNILYFLQIRGRIKQGCGQFTWFFTWVSYSSLDSVLLLIMKSL